MFFSGIRDVIAAFKEPAFSKDPAINGAVELLSTLSAGSGIGFFGKQHKTDAIATAVRLLQEHGNNLTYPQTVEVVNMLQKLDEARSTRRRFGIQVVVTVAVLAIAACIILNFVAASDDLKKVAYGLAGTAVGYWLK